jgi:hypothetical protein
MDRWLVLERLPWAVSGYLDGTENERYVMPRSGLIWTIVGILLIVALLIYIF